MTRPDNLPPRKYYCVIDRSTYEEVEGGKVMVTRESGEWGVFHHSGPWIEGAVTQCNVHMLTWTGGPRLPQACNFRWTEFPTDLGRASNYPVELEEAMPHLVADKRDHPG